jgi:exonuclease III
MKIISWNMRRKQSNWKYLLENLQPDIALLQESAIIEDKSIKSCVTEVTVKKNFRNSIYVKAHHAEPILMPSDHGLGLNVVRVTTNDKEQIYFVSVYGNLSLKPWFIHMAGAISLCIQVLKSKYKAENIVIAGDFNADRRMDENPTGTKFAKIGETPCNDLFNCILGLGFKDCMVDFYPDYIQTHRHNRSSYPWQIDQIIATPKIFQQLISMNVESSEEMALLSDHNPIIAEFGTD